MLPGLLLMLMVPLILDKVQVENNLRIYISVLEIANFCWSIGQTINGILLTAKQNDQDRWDFTHNMAFLY